MLASKRAQQGFSLIEMMLAVGIIGMMAAAITPALSEMMADNRQSSAANTILHIGSRLRAEAFASGRPQLLRYTQSGSNGLGLLEVFAGMGSSCMRTPWAQAFNALPGDPLGPYQVLDMAVWNPTVAGNAPTSSDSGRQVITVRAQSPVGTAVTSLQLCVQRNGQTYTQVPGNPMQRQTVTAVLTVARSIDTRPRGVVRQIAFPVGGSPRWR